MNRKIALLFLFVIGFSGLLAGYRIPSAHAIIWVEGHITSDTTWSPVDTYRVINNTYVDSGVTLTILPGVHVQFGDGLSLFVEGSLNATGTETNPVVFTSGRVAANPPNPYPGAWNTIKFDGGKEEYFTMKYSVITYATNGITIATQDGEALTEKCEIRNNSDNGIMLAGKSNVVIKENTITQNKNGIGTDNSPTHAGIAVSGNIVSANGGNGIELYSYGGNNGYIYNVTFSSNMISSNGGNGIYLYSYGGNNGYIYNVTFSSNMISSNGGSGIYMYSEGYQFGYGYIYDVVFSSNTVSSNGGSGIYMYSEGYDFGYGYIYDVVFSSNIVSCNKGDGIYLYSAGWDGGYIYSVAFLSDTVLANKGDGIDLHSVSAVYNGAIYDVAFSSNMVLANKGDGIYLYSEGIGGYYGYIYSVAFSSNTVSSNGNGIFVEGYHNSSVAFDLTLSRNRVAANKQKGIHFWSIRTNITENSISYNQDGVFYEYATGHLANRNDIYSNTYGMSVTYGATVSAEYNYWGDSTGPYNPSINPEGKGDPVNGNGNDLDFIPFLTSPQGYINQRPVAALSVDKNNVGINETVMFDATNSTDDGRIDYCFFDFGDGINSCWTTLPVVTHKYALNGTYYATVTVMDDYGVTSTNAQLIKVEIIVVPEFPSFLILPMFMIATLLAIIVSRRKRLKHQIAPQQ